MIKKVKDAWYYLKCKYWHKHNQITCFALEPTYIDRCELIRHSMFQVLTDFLEKEDPFHHPGISFFPKEIEGDPFWAAQMLEQSETFLSMIRIYNWYWDIYVPSIQDSVKAHDRAKNITEVLWHKGNKCLEIDTEVLSFRCSYCNEYWDSHHNYEEELNKLVLEKMKELVELSPCMWT